MNFCCDPRFFGGIGIGRLSDFCHGGVEATMVPCRCHGRKKDCCRPEPCREQTADYTTTDRSACGCCR